MEVTRRWFGLTALCGALIPAVSARAAAPLGSDPGVFDDRIVFGRSAALKGPAAALGLGMRDGILAAFHEANAAGGVHGRKLDLISYNDDYEPELAIAKTNKLLGEDRVFALIGEVGHRRPKQCSQLRRSRVYPSLDRSRALTSFAIRL